MSSYGAYVIETFLTLLAVSALAFVLLYAARRAGVGRATGGVSLVGRVPIDSRRSVVLVQVAGQVFVVGVSEAGLTKLGEVPASDLPPAAAEARADFSSVLRGALGRDASSTRGNR